MEAVAQRIWFELDRPASDQTNEVAHERAALASRILEHLHNPEDGPSCKFWWDEREQKYCYGNAGGFIVLQDNGHWLNLSYLGREDLKARYTGPYR